MRTVIQPEDREDIEQDVLLPILQDAKSLTIRTWAGTLKKPRKIEVVDGHVTITIYN